jgi:UDP-2,3-diacylglucosamine hydrolase
MFWFLSDVHLSSKYPQTTLKIINLFQECTQDVQKIFILGDLFDFWIGDDDPNPLHDLIAKGIRSCASNGTSIYFLPGNRDFLLGDTYASKAGFHLISDPYPLIIGNKTFLLTHGDQLCTLDKNYQRYRCVIRHHWIRKVLTHVPLQWRLWIARKIRNTSTKVNQIKAAPLMDVVQKEVVSLLNKYQANTLIHGHTHIQGIHSLDVSNTAQRIVLGAWHEDHAPILTISVTGEIKFIYF